VFTTYALSLSFFEAVVQDALIRGNEGTPCQCIVIADVEGVRNAISEQGARGVGREYQVEPVEVEGGPVFHPKIVALTSPTQSHLVIGSGNLTFGGWGGNLEAFEHLDVLHNADAFDEAASFFAALATAPQIRMAAGSHCELLAEDLRLAARRGARPGTVRILHSLGSSIMDQVVDIVGELGGAERLAVASPFWDGGVAIDLLCRSLGLDQAHVHSHSGDTVKGTASNWPWSAQSRINAVHFDSLEPVKGAKSRRLHAKLFEVVCRRGRLVLSGSANATLAALGGGHNVEACVARITRNPSMGWSWRPAQPPPQMDAEEVEEDTVSQVGILRASVSGDEVVGQVITRRSPGLAIASSVTVQSHQDLEVTEVQDDGSFSFRHSGFEREAWKGTRVVLRLLMSDASTAEGFVAFTSYADVARRLGSMANHLFNILSTGGAAADMAAVISWALANPGQLGRAQFPSGGGSGTGEKSSTEGVRVSLCELQGKADEAPPRPASSDPGAASLNRFWNDLYSSLRQPRGPFLDHADRQDDDEEDEAIDASLWDTEARKGPGKPPRAHQRKASPGNDFDAQNCLSNFGQLFSILVDGKPDERNLKAAYALTQYVCDRLRPGQQETRSYLGRLVGAFTKGGIEPGLHDIALAAICVALADDVGKGVSEAFAWARLKVLRIGLDPNGPAPDVTAADGFRQMLAPDADIATLWKCLQDVRSMPEQIGYYLEELRNGSTSGAYPDLRAKREFWPHLDQVLQGKASKDGVVPVRRGAASCPRCHFSLPLGNAQLLGQRSIVRAGCCNRILVCGEV
jgi:hypothetical protein